MNDPLLAVGTRVTPQSRPADARQVPNSAGGYTFATSDEVAIHRFLTIGTTGGTYYVSEAELTKVNADIVLRAARDRGEWLVEQVVAVSTAGRAPRQNPGLFALAAVAGLGDEAARKAALEALPQVARTGTTLFQFATYVELFRGWGPALRRGIGQWYLDKDVDQLAYQVVKYRQRNGWSHQDLLRLAHPKTDDPVRDALFHWGVTGKTSKVHDGVGQVTAVSVAAPALVRAFVRAQTVTTAEHWVHLIAEYPLSWEMLPDAALSEPKVWRALIRKGMPQTALLRQLPRLTRLGVLEDKEMLATVTAQLADTERLRKARVHPVNVLVAQRTYAAGQGTSSSWTPVRQVVDALDAAFYAAYGAVEPAGKRTLLALDVSGSMGSGVLSPGQKSRGWFTAAPGTLSCREAAAALSLVTLATEPQADVVGFTAGDTGQTRGTWNSLRNTAIRELDISPRRRLDDVVKYTASLSFGGTDIALPFLWAKDDQKDYDTVVVFTDNESWAGQIHPHQALRQYRDQVGHDVKMVVVALAANQFSVADPADPSSIDICGLDAAVPNLIADFSRGEV
jgi:60 kDa SS-A/Ro ribonucleoprotein